MTNNNNQDYIDLRESFAQDYPPEFEPAPPPEFEPPKPEFNFGPKNSNFFMLILISGAVIAPFLVINALTLISSLVHGFNITQIPTWAWGLGSQIMLLGVPCTIYLIIKRKQIKDILPFRPLGWRNTLMIVVLTLVLIPPLYFVNIVSQLVFPNVIGEVMEGVMQEGGIWLSLVIFAFVAPVFEEIAFRGIGFAGFRHVKIGTAAIINGLIFGFLHMNMNQFIYAFLGGVVFCYMMYYTKSIWAPILSHFVVNAFGALMQFFLLHGDSVDFQAVAEVDIPAGGAETVGILIGMGFFALISMAVFIGFYILFKRHNLRRNEAEGIITNTAVAARQAGLRPPKAFTWSFWVAAGIFVFMMLLIYIILPMVEINL